MFWAIIVLFALCGLFLLPAVMLANTLYIRTSLDLSRPDVLEGTRWEPYAPALTAGIPALAALPWEDVSCRAYDGLRLHAYLMRGGGERTVILVHGYRSSGFNDFCGIASYYLDRDFDVLLIDQRAHGKSEGRLSTFGVRESRDVLRWVQYAEENLEGEIWLHGVSMGGNSVLTAAGQALPARVRGIIGDSAFDSPVQILSYQFKRMLRKFPAELLIPFGKMAGVLLVGKDFVTGCASDAVAASEIPILLICGDMDHTVPMNMSDPILTAGGNNRVRVVIHGARHAVCWLQDEKTYAAALDRFLGAPETGKLPMQ